MVENKAIAMKSKATAPYKTFLVLCRAHLITGKYQEFNLLINRCENEFGFSSFGFKNSDAATGT